MTRWLVLLLVASYLILPTLFVILLSFGKDEVLRFPPRLFTTRWYSEFLASSDWTLATLRTLLIGLTATIAASVIGTMAAFSLVRGTFPGKRLVDAAAMAPLVVPPIVLGAGGYSLFLKLHLVGSYTGVAIMHTVLAVPYVVLIVSAALSRIDTSIELASMSLGASAWTTFRKITLPNIAPAVLTGALFAFLASFDEVVVTVFLLGTLGPTLPVRIFASLVFAVSPVVAAVSTLQVAVSIVLLAQLGLIRRWQASRSSHQQVSEQLA
jgi:ABC-type spermidine/putrescine transport system permease subunit II